MEIPLELNPGTESKTRKVKITNADVTDLETGGEREDISYYKCMHRIYKGVHVIQWRRIVGA